MASNINNYEVALFGEFYAKDLPGQFPEFHEIMVVIDVMSKT